MKKVITLILVALFAFTLASCAPKDPVAAKEKLEKAGYSVVVDSIASPAALKALGVEGVKSVLTASKTVETKNDKGETERTSVSVSAVWFESSSAASNAQKTLQEQATAQGEKSEVKKAGSWLYYGDAQGMKDFA